MQPQGLTQLLVDWSEGDPGALDKLMPIVYDELRRLASIYLRREHPGHTLQPTALVNEVICGSSTRHTRNGKTARNSWVSPPN